jgi:hypothetical protein
METAQEGHTSHTCANEITFTRLSTPVLTIFQKHHFTFSFPPLLKQTFCVYCGAEWSILNDLCGKRILGGMMCPIYSGTSIYRFSRGWRKQR